jgi:hypothetical protein
MDNNDRYPAMSTCSYIVARAAMRRGLPLPLIADVEQKSWNVADTAARLPLIRGSSSLAGVGPSLRIGSQGSRSTDRPGSLLGHRASGCEAGQRLQDLAFLAIS